MPANFDHDFKSQYTAAKTALASDAAYGSDWKPLVGKLKKLMADEGFDAAHETALTDLRAAITKGPSQTRTTEDKGLLMAAGAWADGEAGTVVLAAKQRAGALKFLRHVYLLNKAGSRKVWIHSLPTAFTHWPNKHLQDNASTLGAVKTLLRSETEQFTEQQKRYLANSTQQAMAWCQKTGIVLANAGASGSAPNPEKAAARALVRRWFADATVTESDLNGYISRLAQGFKDIVGALNKGHFIVTDWVPFRASTDADEIGYRDAEAFTFSSRAEGLDVVYIESNFFVDNPGNVLPGQANWTRIIVHELTHLVCGTTDVPAGADSRYAWYGIGPHAGYPGSDCITNADNWAFFAADCAAALTDAQRTSALRVR